jgi:hypothetical protein
MFTYGYVVPADGRLDRCCDQHHVLVVGGLSPVVLTLSEAVAGVVLSGGQTRQILCMLIVYVKKLNCCSDDNISWTLHDVPTYGVITVPHWDTFYQLFCAQPLWFTGYSSVLYVLRNLNSGCIYLKILADAMGLGARWVFQGYDFAPGCPPSGERDVQITGPVYEGLSICFWKNFITKYVKCQRLPYNQWWTSYC